MDAWDLDQLRRDRESALRAAAAKRLRRAKKKLADGKLSKNQKKRLKAKLKKMEAKNKAGVEDSEEKNSREEKDPERHV